MWPTKWKPNQIATFFNDFFTTHTVFGLELHCITCHSIYCRIPDSRWDMGKANLQYIKTDKLKAWAWVQRNENDSLWQIDLTLAPVILQQKRDCFSLAILATINSFINLYIYKTTTTTHHKSSDSNSQKSGYWVSTHKRQYCTVLFLGPNTMV